MNSCVLGTEDDLEYYVRECGDILGVSSKLPSSVRDAKHILDYIFHQIVEFKKLNQVPAMLSSLVSVSDVSMRNACFKLKILKHLVLDSQTYLKFLSVCANKSQFSHCSASLQVS